MSLIIIIILNLFLPISYWVVVFGKSKSLQEIRAIYPSTSHMMCEVFISVTSCRSVANGWPGSNWKFLSNPFLIIPNAPIITGTTFFLTLHNLLTSKSRSLYLLRFCTFFGGDVWSIYTLYVVLWGRVLFHCIVLLIVCKCLYTNNCQFAVNIHIPMSHLLQSTGCRPQVSIRKVLRPATSPRGFSWFPCVCL